MSGKYRTIVADPPWEQMGGAGFDGRGHDTRVKRNVGTRTNSRSKPLPYATMKLPEIAALFGRERMNLSLVRWHRELHKELFGELP
ncbi:MAG TPA: hypothetical protein VD761_11920 [Solirubrobacterales bacterium]|nr:hypothetical protein [Solirubrobacterales bacterium]